MFKERSNKKRNINLNPSHQDTTLDAKHQYQVQTMNDDHDRLVIKRDELKELYKKRDGLNSIIKQLQSTSITEGKEYDSKWVELINTNDTINNIENDLKKVSNCENEIAYYTETADILFKYYDILENQDKSETNVPQQLVPKPSRLRKKIVTTNTRNILEALMGLPPPKPNIVKDEPVDKAELVDIYMSKMDNSHIRQYSESNIDVCPKCKNSLTCIYQDGIMICKECEYEETMLVEQNRPVYRQQTKETSHFSYKRINHFNEWLAQIQGKESTDIPEEIFNKIIGEIKKERILDASKITYDKMREICKRLRANRYYEHIPYIITRINNIPPPNFSPDLEEKLRNMFKDIQAPFLKHRPPTRKNFLSYSYVLYKFLQLLEKDEYLKHFSLLKSREKLHVQDQIWKKICGELNWEVYASL